MRPVALIAANFLREQRWVLLALAVYAGGMGAVLAFAGDRPSPSDLIFYAQQQGIMAMLFGVFLISSAIHNDRRSRRLLLIMSKSVSRWQYLMALAMGTVSVSVGFIALAFAGVLVASQRWMLASGMPFEVLLLFLPLSVLAICMGLCFATVLHPFFANALTIILLGGSFGIAFYTQGSAVLFLPGANLLIAELKARGGTELSLGVGVVILQTTALFVLACWLFSRLDLGENIE